MTRLNDSGGRPRWPLPAVLALALLTVPLSAKVKITTKHDETFAFKGLRTWAWHPSGAGEVKMLVTADDNPEAVRQRFEPVIVSAVEQELAKRGFVRVTEGQPDLYANYYLLITVGASSQQMGQFLGAVPEWGLPAMSGATTSFRAFPQGSLVIDLIAPALKSTVWRGVAQAELDRERTPPQRDQRVREAIRDILAKFPPKK